MNKNAITVSFYPDKPGYDTLRNLTSGTYHFKTPNFNWEDWPVYDWRIQETLDRVDFIFYCEGMFDMLFWQISTDIFYGKFDFVQVSSENI